MTPKAVTIEINTSFLLEALNKKANWYGNVRKYMTMQDELTLHAIVSWLSDEFAKKNDDEIFDLLQETFRELHNRKEAAS